MDVSGIGVDIVEIDRMRKVLKRTPSFRERVFTEVERAYCDKKADPAIHYALRFAAKEAVMKALGTGMVGIGFDDIEVENDSFGKPSVTLRGSAKELAGKQGVHEMHLSLSYTHSVGVANVVAVTDDNMPHPDTKVDPREELARAFKAARTMLDELPDTGAATSEEDGIQVEPTPEGGQVELTSEEDGIQVEPTAGDGVRDETAASVEEESDETSASDR